MQSRYHQRRRILDGGDLLGSQQGVADAQFVARTIGKSHRDPFFISQVKSAHSASFDPYTTPRSSSSRTVASSVQRPSTLRSSGKQLRKSGDFFQPSGTPSGLSFLTTPL